MRYFLFGVITVTILSSCTIYDRSVFIHIDDRKNIHNEEIKTNNQQWSSIKPSPSSSSPVVSSSVPVTIEKSQPKIIRVGCKPFEMPELLSLKKLTGQMLEEMKPKSGSEIHHILLDNIQENKRIDDLNRKRIKDAYDKHRESCKN